MRTFVLQDEQGSLHTGFGWVPPPPRNNTVWKSVVGHNPATAHFTLLERPKPRWSIYGASVFLQFLWVGLMIVVPMLFPQRLVPFMRSEVIPLLTPRTEVPLPPKPPPVRVKAQPPPPLPVEQPRVAKLVAPPRPKAPKPKPVEVSTPVVTPVFQAATLNAPKSEPARPREPVKTGMLSTGSAAPATVHRPAHEVQTGGFGDPNGIPGKGDPNKRGNIAQKGSFDLPGGPGYGNGTGGASGVRGTVASAGFGSGVAIQGPGGQGRGQGTVRQGGFSDASAPAEAPKPRAAAPAASAVQPVEILEKPNPIYSQEARNLKLEGEVLLEVIFPASGGPVRVLRVIRGLGHGLDESAMRAAQQIRYKPARRADGQPVDFPATVHIVFQLAY